MANIDIKWTERAREMYHEHFGWHDNQRLTITVRRNNRLKRAMGRFVFTSAGQPLYIELAGFTLDNGTDEQIADTLLHELTHYHLFKNGEPFHDGDPHFEAELKRVGAPSTNTVSIKRNRTFHVYKCDCDTYTFRNKFRTARYCKVCGEDVRYAGKKEVFC